RDAREAVLLLDELADLLVLDQEGAEVLLLRVPARAPVIGDADAEPGRTNLLTHGLPLPRSGRGRLLLLGRRRGRPRAEPDRDVSVVLLVGVSLAARAGLPPLEARAVVDPRVVDVEVIDVD